jgi:hypothetical protein
MNSNRIKFYILLAQSLGLLVTLIGSFLGGLYIFNGQWLFALPVSLFFVACMYYLVVYFCREKEKKKKRGYPSLFYYLFALYAVISIALSIFVLHFYHVEFLEKKEIQRIGLKKLEGLKLLYKEYDNSYASFIDNKKANIIEKLKDYKKTTARKKKIIEEELAVSPYFIDQDMITSLLRTPDITKNVEEFMRPSSNKFEHFKNQLLQTSGSNEFIQKNETILNQWDRFALVKSLNDLNKRVTNDYDQLNKQLITNSTPEYAIQNFAPQIYTEETLINKPIELASKHLGPITLLVLLAFQMLILLPYFLTKGRNYGTK